MSDESMDKRQKESYERIHNLAMSYKRVFEDSEDGYKVLMDLMAAFHMLRPTYLPGSENQIDMAFKEGGRNVILYILSKCEIDINSLESLIREADKNA